MGLPTPEQQSMPRRDLRAQFPTKISHPMGIVRVGDVERRVRGSRSARLLVARFRQPAPETSGFPPQTEQFSLLLSQAFNFVRIDSLVLEPYIFLFQRFQLRALNSQS